MHPTSPPPLLRELAVAARTPISNQTIRRLLSRVPPAEGSPAVARALLHAACCNRYDSVASLLQYLQRHASTDEYDTAVGRAAYEAMCSAGALGVTSRALWRAAELQSTSRVGVAVDALCRWGLRFLMTLAQHRLERRCLLRLPSRGRG